ncbi:hypothetical protein ABFS83_02G106200 [Erythranthe nasuta]
MVLHGSPIYIYCGTFINFYSYLFQCIFMLRIQSLLYLFTYKNLNASIYYSYKIHIFICIPLINDLTIYMKHFFYMKVTQFAMHMITIVFFFFPLLRHNIHFFGDANIDYF